MMQRIKNLLAPKKILLAACCYTVIISIALLSPTDGIPKVSIKNLDKVVHFGIHFILTIFWLSYFYFGPAFQGKTGKNLRQISIGTSVNVLIAILLYGILIELLQTYFTSGRTGDIYDVLANGVGLIAGFITFLIFQKRIL